MLNIQHLTKTYGDPDFTVAATNGRVTIQRVWDQYLASTKHGITGNSHGIDHVFKVSAV